MSIVAKIPSFLYISRLLGLCLLKSSRAVKHIRYVCLNHPFFDLQISFEKQKRSESILRLVSIEAWFSRTRFSPVRLRAAHGSALIAARRRAARVGGPAAAA